MPTIRDAPRAIRPYLFLGLDLDYQGREQALGECPLCYKSKFYCNVENGLWDCKSCGGKGNALDFLRILLEESGKTTSISDYEELVLDRGLLYPDTLSRWGVCKSFLTMDWLIPGYSVNGKLHQIYRYLEVGTEGDTDNSISSGSRNGKKRKLLPTPGLYKEGEAHALHYAQPLNKRCKSIFIVEGCWDGMVLWEVLSRSRERDLQDTSVIAVPGCNVFLEGWNTLFSGKRVTILYDSDHPVRTPQGTSPPAGYSGIKRVVKSLLSCDTPPEEIRYLRWGPEGYDPRLPSGYDIRDILSSEGDIQGRGERLREVSSKVVSISQEWITEAISGRGKGKDLECIECNSWKDLRNEWRKALKWTEGLDGALPVMLGSVISTKLLGDPIWLKIIGPASCGKSTLCEALSVNRKYVHAESIVTGFHSGYKLDREGKEDFGLIAKIKDKTFVVKDGDTLLQAPNLSQILAQGRDLYDGTSRAHYGHGLTRHHAGVRMTWILCGTESLRYLDSSELGERFLDYVIMEVIDTDIEDEINWRSQQRVIANRSVLSDGKACSHQDSALTRAMQLTGGYVTYLRENASELLEKVTISEEQATRCRYLGKFIAYMRARPSKKQDESVNREMSTRLVNQLTRLALCIAAVLNKDSIDRDVMRVITKVALDTSRGRTLRIMEYLYGKMLDYDNAVREGREVLGGGGADIRTIAHYTNQTETKERPIIQFLRQLGTIEPFLYTPPGCRTSRQSWRLTPGMKNLYCKVLEGTREGEDKEVDSGKV